MNSDDSEKNELMEREKCLKQLHDSFTFQMSLGSKELFHTNFLEWLSIINMDMFINLMHTMAGLKVGEHFWWEDFDKEKIEIRREFNHYDLSVYVEINEKWCPVLILENKVKSMPYKKQLNNYKNKAYREWKSCLLPRIRKTERINQTWNEKGITFILLTLFAEHIDLPRDWKVFKYDSLEQQLEGISEKTTDTKHQLIITDYCQFIKSLYNLANADEWKVYPEDIYYYKIIMGKKKEADLRIADLREKIIHERMLQILVDKLKRKDWQYEHWDKDYESKNKKDYKTGIVYYQTSFSRGKGITEAFVIINKDYRLMIQLQGEQYRRCLILHKISNDSAKKRDTRWKKILDELKNKKLWVKDGSDWTEDYNPQNKFGDYFKYSYKKIGENDTVNKVLDAMIEDFNNIIKLYKFK